MESAYKPTGSWDMEEITLKQDEFFIMPDDRENGLPDAAAMRVKQEQLIGRAAIRVAPFITVMCVFQGKIKSGFKPFFCL